MRASLAALVALLAVACGGGPPARFVFERDIGDWTYRRYQRVLDVEIPIAGNPAVGHTATYIRRPDQRREAVPFVTVFVTVYDQAPGLAAEVRRTMRDLASYDVEVRPVAGAFTWFLDGGRGDRWVLWVSRNRVVKVGASEELRDVPVSVVAQYLGPYPSDLDQFGRARPGALSAGEHEEEGPAEESTDDEELPTYLRENAPR